MAVLHDFRCMAHGVFESMTGECPHGCSQSFVEKVFLKAPGIHSDRTKNIDSTLAGLASDFGLTNMNNNNGNQAAVIPDWKAMKEREQLLGKLGDTSQAWGQIPKSDTGVSQAIQATKVLPDNQLANLKPTFTQPIPNVVGRDTTPLTSVRAAE